jgi:hypothetical protein
LGGADGTLKLAGNLTGFTSNPQIFLQNYNTTTGANVGVPSYHTYKVGRNAVAGDVISSQHFYAKNYNNVKTEFARIEASVRNTGLNNDDGSIAFSGLINGVQTEFFRINGADSENNMFLPIDMNGQSIKTSSGDLTITSASSSNAGIITISSKTQTPTTTSDMVFNVGATPTLSHASSTGWDFKANNITTTGNITCNTLNYTTLNPAISGGGVVYAGIVNISTILTTLTGTGAYNKIYTYSFNGTAEVKLPVLGTNPLRTITFTLCGVGPGNDIAIKNSDGVLITTLVGGAGPISFTFVDNTTSWVWL